MRLSRSSLLSRLTGPDVPNVVLLEAPAGYGKSWLIRRAAGDGATKLRGEIGPPFGSGNDPVTLVIDDAHLLDDDDVDRLVERIEDAPPDARLFIAGRMLPDAVHEVAQLVDGLIIDANGMALTPDEVAAELGDGSEGLARQIVDAADGCVRVVATAVEQTRRTPHTDAFALTSRVIRAIATDVVQQLGAPESAIVALLARTPGLEPSLLQRLGGPRFLRQALSAGVPLRRQVTGGLDVAMASSFRDAPIDATSARLLADTLFARGRAIEAIGLLLDAGGVERAAQLLMDLSESIADTVEPQVLLALLARLGPATDREPLLLLRRSTAERSNGRIDAATSDIDRAVELATNGDPAVRRRVNVEAARARLAEGRRDEAVAIVDAALLTLGEGEGRTYASAYEVLAEAAATSDSRAELQRAADCYRIAVSAWEGCGESARARACRRDLASGVLTPLGRYDEALSQLNQLLSVAELSDTERSTTILFEGFVLESANRLESAESRFIRATDLGYVQENPRLIAAAAYGRALIGARRGDLAETLRWVATAENTAMSEDDVVLGVPFLCDTANALGALGELELAERYLARAVERHTVFPDQVRAAAFILDARKGVLGDLDEALRCTPPADWWRVKLVAAYAAAKSDDAGTSRNLFADVHRELLALGFTDAESQGEGRTEQAIQALLQHRVTTDEPLPVPTPRPRVQAPAGRQVRVIGESICVYASEESLPIPVGNPQRLVGVVVAHGGSATFDQLSDAIWPSEELERSRTRLRNVLLRLRRAVGDIVVRSGVGVRLAPGITCDLHQFEQQAADALSSARADPDLAGRLAKEAVERGDGGVFVDFEYEEWAVAARRHAEQQLIGLFDLLSVQAEDAGDIPLAQALAERALRLDRYTDSRYVRLAELLTLQDRVAAAIAVLDDAAEVAREMGGVLPTSASDRRKQLMRGTAAGA